jgi:hypothetical protein
MFRDEDIYDIWVDFIRDPLSLKYQEDDMHLVVFFYVLEHHTDPQYQQQVDKCTLS